MSDVLVAVIGEKGSPGATTTALALAAATGGPAFMIEADAFGGDLAFRCRHAGLPLAETPTVLTAAAAVRHAAADDVLAQYSHEFSEAVRVIPGHLAAEQAFSTDWQAFADALGASRQSVVLDLGRIHAASPTLGLAVRADVVVPVLKADVTSVMRTLDRLTRLVPELAKRRDAVPAVLPLVVATPRHGPAVAREVRELLAGSRVSPAVRDVGWIAYDSSGVKALYGGRAPRRGRLMTSASQAWVAVTNSVTGRSLGSGQSGGVNHVRA